MRSIFSLLLLLALFASCEQSGNKLFMNVSADQDTTFTDEVINPDGMTIETRIRTPKGFERSETSANSFEEYLRKLPLKDHGTEVKLFDGRTKTNNDVYDAVVDLKIGNKDLHQCADAVMRLRAEYLWNQKKYNEIHFNFTNGFRVEYSEYMKGKRMVVKGNQTYWSQSASASNTYTDFWKYMELIFNYAGTLSLSKEMKTITIDQLNIGDVFIKGGSPGHAVIIVDLATNSETGEKIFLLAQSYMPAQEIQLLKNPLNEEQSPWYSADFGNVLNTPEWTFYANELKRF